ncbi:hypothetical protein ACIPY6_28555 [Streptomyces sp. NPDC090054]|uniref:hypothetical protein n=1 Tax=Streptomyces sp. NPDC090054 TaxID=3365933 RepID=UPI0037FA8022
MTGTQPPLFLPGWDIEPCDTAPPPRRPRTDAATRLRQLRERRIEPEAGRAAGSARRWTPGGDDIHITTLRPPVRYL